MHRTATDLSPLMRALAAPPAKPQPSRPAMTVRLMTGMLEACHRWIDVVTMATALFGVVLYFREAPERRVARDTAAWQILALQEDQTGNGGRRWAMEALNDDHIELHGLHLVRADFSGSRTADGAWRGGARLDGARLNWSTLWSSNLGGAHLRRAELHHAALLCTVLSGADLSQADLSDADLSGAEVTEADFSGARLDGARLSQACVRKGGRRPAGLSGAVFPECAGWGAHDNPACKGDSPAGRSAPSSAAVR